ncbi:hypothetical protein [Azospirillum lipoferum]|uniref:hypothetical protein n=1 Tax=Azospirillum lipoferum TaxID=193 RepID=UPI00139622AF|nr:hypothetical protein [Azospirillum lipoferum]
MISGTVPILSNPKETVTKLNKTNGRFAQLRAVQDKQRRGYVFEQYIREDLPWGFRPPLSVGTDSEQIDAFFEFNGWHFLVECKAKSENITPGSHDWEDFELKIRRRGGQCIGLFCSLWPLSEGVYSAADNLNRANHTVIIIAGQQWDEMEFSGLTYSDLLRFLVSEARARSRTVSPPIVEIQKQLANASENEKHARSVLRSASTVFLRRHRSPRHDQLYVERALDREIRDLLTPLTPSKLGTHSRTTQRGVSHGRARPIQLAIIRDNSGAGKTTLSANLAESSTHLGVVKAALEPDIDGIREVLQRLSRDDGLTTLNVINKPMLYVLDSLDEASIYPQKNTELRGLFNALKDLNDLAESRGLICYPILILLTIRHEYWRDWESQLEGRKSRIFTKRFSRFSENELSIAIKKYEDSYKYSIENRNADLLDALSHPFTLQVYSEANEYAGPVDAREHFGSSVLHLFFERKKEDILKRPVQGFDGETMLKICTAVAVEMVCLRSNEMSEEDAKRVISKSDITLKARSSAIIRILKSEQIFSPESSEGEYIRFRHSRFLEYLLAIEIKELFKSDRIRPSEGSSSITKYAYLPEYSISGANNTNIMYKNLIKKYDNANYNHSGLGNSIGEIYTIVSATKFASPYVVFDYLKSICSSDERLLKKVSMALANSSKYMDAFLLQKRLELGRGNGLKSEEVRAIKLGMADKNPEICWNGFFVLAAAISEQNNKSIIQAFELAWDTNVNRSDLYKIIPKLKKHGLLFDEEFLRRLRKSYDCQCWLSFLDQIDVQLAKDFPDIWNHMGGASLEQEIKTRPGTEWNHVLKLLNYVTHGEPFPLGGVL